MSSTDPQPEQPVKPEQPAHPEQARPPQEPERTEPPGKPDMAEQPGQPEVEDRPPSRGHLKIYLGYASHTGKTWRLLEEARRRKSRGQDVVVGWVREKDQPAVADLLSGLERIPPVLVGGQAALAVETILRRAPEVCFIDELAHENPPGSRHAHRWEDVEELLAAGIGVVTAMNIQYLEGLQKEVARILGRAPEVTVPDSIVRDADERMLVDTTADAVLGRSRSSGGLSISEHDLLALRELALLYSADTAEDELEKYRLEHKIHDVWETKERILVGLTAYSRGPHLIERAQRAASRWNGELFAVYVTPDVEKFQKDRSPDAERVRGFLALAESHGAKVDVVPDTDPARGLLDFARRHDVTQLFLGHAAAYPYRGALSGTVAGRIILEAAGMDVNLISDEGAPLRQSTDAASAPSLPFLSRLLAAPPRPASRGHLRVYLGYAPGAGKTWQMLLDGRYLKAQGQDVVVGYCDPHDRQDLVDQLSDFEVVPPRRPVEGNAVGMDVPAVVARRPTFCLVDGLATPTADGRRRWQEVEELRDAGTHVFATVDVSEVEGLKDAVERITGLRVRSTVPDWILDEADELIFVDVAVRALLNRVKRGVVFPGQEVPEGMQGLFTEGSLNALRELGMRMTADRVQDEREALEDEGPPPEAFEALMVSIHQRPTAACAVRRARRTAERIGATCYAVYVAPDEDWTGISPEDRAAIESHLELARTLHIDTHVLYGSHIAKTIVDFAIRHRVTRLFLGRSYKTGWREFFQRSVVEQVIRLAPWADIVVVADRSQGRNGS